MLPPRPSRARLRPIPENARADLLVRPSVAFGNQFGSAPNLAVSAGLAPAASFLDGMPSGSDIDVSDSLVARSCLRQNLLGRCSRSGFSRDVT